MLRKISTLALVTLALLSVDAQKNKKDAFQLVMVGRKFRPFFMLSFKNLVGISSSKND